MKPAFIFMLTRKDRTVPEARSLLPEVFAAGVGHVGFKNIGLPHDELRLIAEEARAAGATVYLEVVSLDPDSEAASARAALDLGVDVLMGGTRPKLVVPILAGSGIRYFPFAGRVEGHPSRLEGSIRSIVASAGMLLDQDGVDGLDLLAYRFRGDSAELARQVCAAAGRRPVFVAGSIDSVGRIREVLDCGAAGFTIGSAILEGRLPGAPAIHEQLRFVDRTVREWEDEGRF